MSSKDFYKLLGVPRNATDGEIKSAFRKLALQCHPDRNPGNKQSEDKFKEINEAYEILSDAGKRRTYDQFGYDAVNSGAGAHGFGDFQNAEFGDLFSNIFETVFGGDMGNGRHSHSGRRGADLKYDIEISLEDAYTGVMRPINFERTEICPTCKGSGAKPGFGLKRCSTCRGSGRVQYVQGFFALTQTCPDCSGQGEVVETPCKNCRGAGRVKGKTSVNIKIPPGVQEGTTLRIQRAGDAGLRDVESGDLYVHVHIHHHSVFERTNDDLLYTCRLNFPQAAMGCRIELPSIDGPKTEFEIPEGVQHGAVLRVAGKGMPSLGGRKKGDLMVKIAVDIPHELTENQKRLLSEFAESLKEQPEKTQDSGFFKKVFG